MDRSFSSLTSSPFLLALRLKDVRFFLLAEFFRELWDTQSQSLAISSLSTCPFWRWLEEQWSRRLVCGRHFPALVRAGGSSNRDINFPWRSDLRRITSRHLHKPSTGRFSNLDPLRSLCIIITRWQLVNFVKSGMWRCWSSAFTPVVSWLWWSRREARWLQRGPPANRAPQSGAAWNTSPYCGTGRKTDKL